MSSPIFLTYWIYTTDKSLVESAKVISAFPVIGRVTEGSIILAPTLAATRFDAPIKLNADPYTVPSIMSEWFESANNFPRDQTTFTKKSGGWFGIPLLFGSTKHYYWRGKFIWQDPNVVGASPVLNEAAVAMAQRYWIDGAELASQGEGGSGNVGPTTCRGASRHLDGYGWKFDNHTLQKSHSFSEFGAATTKAWERFYIRVHRNPTGPKKVWSVGGASSSGNGGAIFLLPDGHLAMYALLSPSTESLVATLGSVLTPHTWVKIDVLYQFATQQFFTVWINGVWTASYTGAGAGTGFASAQNIGTSSLGGGSALGECFDIDDWTAQDWPLQGTHSGPFPPLSGGSGKTAPGKDWNAGTRVARTNGKANAATMSANWTGGDYREVSQHDPNSAATAVVLSSIVALSRMAVVADAIDTIDKYTGAMGFLSMVVGTFGTRGTTSGQLGYKLPGGAAVMAAIVEGVSISFQSVMYRPAGIVDPVKTLAGLELYRDKGNDVSVSTTYMLAAAVELIGHFGPEDYVVASSGAAGLPTETPGLLDLTPANRSYHNAPYWNSPWAKAGPPPISNVTVIGGTYVGNGTRQAITFAVPITMLMVRAVSGSQTVSWWMAPFNSLHLSFAYGESAEIPISVKYESNGAAAEDQQETKVTVTIVGANAGWNANTIVYQYFVWSDPGMRFSEAGVLDVKDGTIDYIHSLVNPTFTPEALFLQRESTGGTTGAYFKGQGHAANAASVLDGAETASLLAMGLGTITAKPNLFLASVKQISFIAFRRADGLNDPGQGRVLQLATYTGDGSASRSVSLAPASGKRPLIAFVIAHNASSYYRDPSHTGTTSHQLPNTNNASSGITGGGIDSISLGANLNSNGIVYDVFVIPGDSTAGNGGWSINGRQDPVEPDAPLGGTGIWGDTPEDPELDPGDDDDGEPEPGGDATDFGEQCVAASTKIINQALSRLGVTKQVGDVTTELSQEAESARLHYSDDLSATLRDFAWPFATRYADLVLVDGATDDPVNGDWVYSYRAPADMMFARRVITPGQQTRGWDPNPITFRVGGDATGTLIYTNQADATLEYTIRPACAASSGDPLFRSALAWRHAHSLAAPLARDEKKQDYCWKMYQWVLGQAATAAANETQNDKPGDVDWIEGR